MNRNAERQAAADERAAAVWRIAGPLRDRDVGSTTSRGGRPLRAVESAVRPTSRAGFTLIEVIVALGIAGLVLVSARALLTAVADSADRIALAAVTADRDANAERLLRGLFLQVDTSDGDRIHFIGNERALRFVTWCDVPAGWQERCTVTLGVVSVEGEFALTVLIDNHEMIIVRRGTRSGALRYLYSPAAGGTWLPSWESVTSTPLAVAAIVDGDTLFLRIGERG